MSKASKKFVTILAVCSAGTLLQTGPIPGSCAQYYLALGVTSFDWCSVFNCTDSTYFDLCPYFVDCPQNTGTQP
jgi:hypothetical protein